MPETRSAITWSELLDGEPSIEVIRKIEESMHAAAGEGKRLEIEGRAKPAGGGRDEQIFCKTFDPASQPPTPANVILDALARELRSGLGDDFAGRIRLNFRQKGSTRNVYTSYSRNVMPMDDDDEEDVDFDFDDEGGDETGAARVPRVPIHPAYQQPHNPYQEPSWQSPPGLPAVDMHGAGRVGSSAYQRRRMNAGEVGLSEPLSEFLMAPQWGALVDMMGGHNDRQVRATLEMVGTVQSMFERVVAMNEAVTLRVLDNNAPGPLGGDRSSDPSTALLGVGMKMMKMMKKQEGRSNGQPTPAPAWGGATPSSTGERTGDWNQPALHLPKSDPQEWGEPDDFDADFEGVPRPDPEPSGGSGGAVAHEPPAGLLGVEDLSSQVKALARQNPEAMKSMVLNMKDELADALDIDKDMLDAFMDDDDE